MNSIGRQAIRQALAELADEDFQNRLWMAQLEGMMGSFDEAQEALFTDSTLDHALEKGEIVFSESIDTALKELGALLKKIDTDRQVEQILADPRMDEIRSKAASILFAVIRDEPLTLEGPSGYE